MLLVKAVVVWMALSCPASWNQGSPGCVEIGPFQTEALCNQVVGQINRADEYIRQVSSCRAIKSDQIDPATIKPGT